MGNNTTTKSTALCGSISIKAPEQPLVSVDEKREMICAEITDAERMITRFKKELSVLSKDNGSVSAYVYPVITIEMDGHHYSYVLDNVVDRIMVMASIQQMVENMIKEGRAKVRRLLGELVDLDNDLDDEQQSDSK